MEDNFFAVIIGAGPAGLACARALAMAGKRVALVDKNPVGGVCLNNGCIPTKFRLSRLNEAVSDVLPAQRKAVDDVVSAIENSLKRSVIEVVYGEAVIDSPSSVVVDGRVLFAENIVLAVGSSPRPLPDLPFDGERVFSAEELLWKQSLSDNSVLRIVGAGAIGIEFAFMFRGVVDKVVVYEVADEILPNEDAELASRLRAIMRKLGIEFQLGRPVASDALSSGTVLVGIGRVAHNGLDSLLNNLDIARDNAGFIKTDEFYRTSIKNVYAIGECRGKIFLANPANYEGKQAARVLLGEPPEPLEYVSRCVFSNPVIGFVGEASDDLEYGSIAFPHGEMRLIYPIAGKLKLGIDGKGVLKYAGILGPGAAELLPFFELAIKKAITFKELKGLLYVHPTVCEAVARVRFK